MKSEMVKSISKNDLNRVKELVTQGYPINEPTAELGLTWITWYNPILGNQGQYQIRKYDYTEEMGEQYFSNKYEGWRGLRFGCGDVDYMYVEKCNIFCQGKPCKWGYNIPWTPLQYSSCLGNTEMVEYFLKIGANPLFKDISGLTAADIAKRCDNVDCEKLLYQASSNIITMKRDKLFQKKHFDYELQSLERKVACHGHIVAFCPMLKDPNILKTCSSYSLEKFLHFLYTSDIPNLCTETILDLFEISKKLEFIHLEQILFDISQELIKSQRIQNKEEITALKKLTQKLPNSVNFKKEIQSLVSSLYFSGRFSNVTIKSRDGILFKLHKQIICSLPYFDQLLTSEKGNQLTLGLFHSKSLKLIFDLLYLGEMILDDDLEIVKEVFVLTKLNCLEDIQKSCILKFTQLLNTKTLYSIITICFEFGISGDLFESCIRTISLVKDFELLRNLATMAKKKNSQRLFEKCAGKMICISNKENSIHIITFFISYNLDLSMLLKKLELEIGKFETDLLKLFVSEAVKRKELEGLLVEERKKRREFEVKMEEMFKKFTESQK